MGNTPEHPVVLDYQPLLEILVDAWNWDADAVTHVHDSIDRLVAGKLPVQLQSSTPFQKKTKTCPRVLFFQQPLYLISQPADSRGQDFYQGWGLLWRRRQRETNVIPPSRARVALPHLPRGRPRSFLQVQKVSPWISKSVTLWNSAGPSWWNSR